MMDRDRDIIVPIKDNLGDLRPCLNSVIKYTDYPYRLILIDDGSDQQTKDFLKSFIQRYKNTTLITNLENMGFVKSCNKGLAISKGDYIIILNSDTIVTSNWLTKMVRCAESDARIGIVNPLSNFALNFSIEILPGYDIFSMAETIEKISKKLYPDIATAVGFCFMITRNTLNALGGFDEIYQEGYHEETDYCMRAIAKGFKVVACDDTFVYHKGHGTFKDYEQRCQRNRRIFYERWKNFFEKAVSEFNKNNPLRYIRESLDIRRPDFSMWDALKTDMILLSRGVKNCGAKYALSRVLHHLRARDSISFTKLEDLSKKDKNRLKMTFILDELVTCGGVDHIIAIVNELILQGIEAKIISYHHKDYIKDHTLYTQPIIITDNKHLKRYLLHSDIFIVTSEKLAHDVKKTLNRNTKIKIFRLDQYEEYGWQKVAEETKKSF